MLMTNEEETWVIEVFYPAIHDDRWEIVHKTFAGQESERIVRAHESRMMPTTLEACVKAFHERRKHFLVLTVIPGASVAQWRFRNTITQEIVSADVV